MKQTEAPEPAVSYHAADEEVQLRSARSDEDEDLPAIYQEASFATVAPAAVPPPPHYSTLPRAGRNPSHGELSRRLSALSQ
jgi:hypothetical protein